MFQFLFFICLMPLSLTSAEFRLDNITLGHFQSLKDSFLRLSADLYEIRNLIKEKDMGDNTQRGIIQQQAGRFNQMMNPIAIYLYNANLFIATFPRTEQVNNIKQWASVIFNLKEEIITIFKGYGIVVNQ